MMIWNSNTHFIASGTLILSFASKVLIHLINDSQIALRIAKTEKKSVF